MAFYVSLPDTTDDDVFNKGIVSGTDSPIFVEGAIKSIKAISKNWS
jgi:hypothetical protein